MGRQAPILQFLVAGPARPIDPLLQGAADVIQGECLQDLGSGNMWTGGPVFGVTETIEREIFCGRGRGRGQTATDRVVGRCQRLHACFNQRQVGRGQGSLDSELAKEPVTQR
ncbi:hypothetical protein D3C86_1509170 [compost metagenome]